MKNIRICWSEYPGVVPVWVACMISWMQFASGVTCAAAEPTSTPDATQTEVFAASGAGQRWVAIGRWTSSKAGMDVFSFPVFAQAEGKEVTVQGGLFTAKYLPLRDVPVTARAVFRLARLPPREVVDLLEWPTADNGHQLVIRTRPPVGTPLRSAGFELQICMPGKDMGSSGGQNAGTAPTDPKQGIIISIETTPPGATVSVGEREVQGRNGLTLTPCKLQVPAGEYAIRLALAGHLDMSPSKTAYTADTQISWRFLRDNQIVQKSFAIPSRTRWTSSGTKVVKGDVIAVEVTGTWSCGSKQEQVGAEGYPVKDPRFHDYYSRPDSSPRQLPETNYGALLMRIGPDGKPMAVGSKFQATADLEGNLFFDVNESIEPASRKDNTGSLQLQLTITPAAMATSAGSR